LFLDGNSIAIPLLTGFQAISPLYAGVAVSGADLDKRLPATDPFPIFLIFAPSGPLIFDNGAGGDDRICPNFINLR